MLLAVSAVRSALSGGAHSPPVPPLPVTYGLGNKSCKLLTLLPTYQPSTRWNFHLHFNSPMPKDRRNEIVLSRNVQLLLIYKQLIVYLIRIHNLCLYKLLLKLHTAYLILFKKSLTLTSFSQSSKKRADYPQKISTMHLCH